MPVASGSSTRELQACRRSAAASASVRRQARARSGAILLDQLEGLGVECRRDRAAARGAPPRAARTRDTRADRPARWRRGRCGARRAGGSPPDRGCWSPAPPGADRRRAGSSPAGSRGKPAMRDSAAGQRPGSCTAISRSPTTSRSSSGGRGRGRGITRLRALAPFAPHGRAARGRRRTQPVPGPRHSRDWQKFAFLRPPCATSDSAENCHPLTRRSNPRARRRRRPLGIGEVQGPSGGRRASSPRVQSARSWSSSSQGRPSAREAPPRPARRPAETSASQPRKHRTPRRRGEQHANEGRRGGVVELGSLLGDELLPLERQDRARGRDAPARCRRARRRSARSRSAASPPEMRISAARASRLRDQVPGSRRPSRVIRLAPRSSADALVQPGRQGRSEGAPVEQVARARATSVPRSSSSERPPR